MKNLKKYTIILSVVILVLVLSACGKKDAESKDDGAQTIEIATEAEVIKTTEVTTEATTEATTDADAEEYIGDGQYAPNMASGDITTQMPLATGPSSAANIVPIKEPDPNVDVDLTAYSINDMVVVLNSIILNPDEYLGKTIKISGPYHPLLYEGTGKYYHYIMIQDETACCENGVEFIWDEGSHTYPDEYPEHDEMIEITGVYSVYEEEGYTYYYLDTDGYTIVY